MKAGELKRAIRHFISVLEGLEIPYYIGGSVASSVLGLPRSTMDVDIIADIDKSHVKELVRFLQNDYYIDEDVVLRAITRRSSFNIIHFETMMKLDIFTLKDRTFDQEAFARKITDALGDEQDQETYYFSSAEDIILNKLEWFKMGGEVSERQWKDTIGVLKIQEANLDYSYLNRWAKELELTDLLERALRESKK